MQFQSLLLFSDPTESDGPTHNQIHLTIQIPRKHSKIIDPASKAAQGQRQKEN